MVQAPPSLLWAAGRRSAAASAGSSSSNAAQDDSAKPSELKHKAKARVPSFTSSPLTQRPLSPSAMSDSGSESSTSTVAIDIARPKLSSVANRNHGKHRSISAITFGETFASPPSSENEESAESYDTFQPANASSRHGPGPNDQETQRLRRRSLSSHSHSSPSALRASVSPTTSPIAQRSHRRRSSGNFGLSPSHGIATSPTPPGSPSLFSSSFVGSYEASLLSGRMANKPSNAAALPFTAQLGVLGLGKNTPKGLKCPEHITLPFGAYFWDMDNQERQGKGSPYVGTIDLEEHYISEYEKAEGQALSEGQRAPKFPGYRIPPKGQIQLVVKNANQTAVKLFLVPYDLSDMPPGSKTFLRQKSYDVPTSSSPSLSPSPSGSPSPRPKETLRYAIHLQFCSPPVKEKERGRKKSVSVPGKAMNQSRLRHSSGSTERGQKPRPRRSSVNNNTSSRIYLHKNIRIVFTPRALDLSEKLKVVMEGPTGLVSDSSGAFTPDSVSTHLAKERYTSYIGPGETWEEARKRKQELDRAFERRMHLEDPFPLDPNAASLSVHSLLHSSPALLARSEQMPLLNTPPSILPAHISNAAELQDAAAVPEPLTFQRSPTPITVPLPNMVESGLSISRPGSRAELRRQHSPPSPEKRSFRSFMPSEALR